MKNLPISTETVVGFTKPVPCKIGDGTAPPGWPAYSAGKLTGIVCRFEGCGHTGGNGAPARMDCKGLQCECSCCRFLAGAVEHGCTYGR